jgi:hypothetical protein
LYCTNFYGQIIERSLVNGQLTGRQLPTVESVSQLSVADEGRELVATGEGAPFLSRWRIDGTGPITRRVARGQAADSYGPSGEELLVAEVRSVVAGGWVGGPPGEAADIAVWDIGADAVLDPLEGFSGSWVGPRVLGGSFADGSVGVYDLDTRAKVPGVEVSTGQGLWYVAPAERTYQLIQQIPSDPATGVLKTYDSSGEPDGGDIDIGPEIPLDGVVQSVSATAEGRRVVVTVGVPVSDGSTTVGWTNLTTVYDGRSGRAIGEPIEGPVVTQVSADGTLLGAGVGTITEYDLDTLRPIGEFPGEGGQVSRIQFSHDGRLAVVSSNDESVSIYDVATRSRLGDPIPGDSPSNTLATLRPDGGALAVNVEGGIEVWDLDPGRLAEATCGIVGRNLTRTEWATYMSDFGDYRRTCPDLP